MLGAETVQIRTAAGVDDDGWATPAGTPADVEGALIEPLGGAELLEATRTGATSALRVFLPVIDGITAADEVKVRGLWYRIVGDPVAYVNDEDPDLSGYVLTCTRGEG